ncbi:ATPase AAA [Shewanella mangrovi]|uniref:ATPase AAA n=2 Tax=Shewanella mangrovi TaxID=1515746 RepID=A0A094K2C8_9GAMM|nr:ATPase AAA [Shewanella mangrovi]
MDRQSKRPPAETIWKRCLLVLDPEKCLPECSKYLNEAAWSCLIAASAVEALPLLRKHNIRVAVAFISKSNQGHLAKDISAIQAQCPALHWIAVSDCTLDKSSAWILSANFIDYYHRPFDWQRFADTLGHAWGMAQLSPSATSKPAANRDMLPAIKGDHPLLQALRTQLHKFGQSDETVLLSGETGSGKGLCAKWLHYLSERRNGPFVTVNCGALPAGLIHSTLFGHEKGAFTDADKRYIGHLEQADGGTLFLDEIADLPLDLQVNLLHFLDDKQILRIGSNKPITVNCRLLFASHQDLENAIDEGRFREDLYHRINVLRLHVPSLRQYSDEVMLLAEQFIQSNAENEIVQSFSDDACCAMKHYDWPGNVRELRNRIRRASVMSDDGIITASLLGLDHVKKHALCHDLASRRDELDAEVLLKAISDHKHNISAAARSLNISRATFYRLLKKCRIES